MPRRRICSVRSAPPLSPALFFLTLHSGVLRVLRLPPVGRAAGEGARALPLGDDALEPERASVLEDRRAVALDVLDQEETGRMRCRQHPKPGSLMRWRQSDAYGAQWRG